MEPLTRTWHRVQARWSALRERFRALDHAARAVGRYSDDKGSQLAASVTLPGFLAFFPLLALAFAVLGFTVTSSMSAQRDVLDAVQGYFPGLLCSRDLAQYRCSGGSQIDVTQLQSARNAATVIGVAGLLVAGLGWVSSLRTALRSVWHEPTSPGFVLLEKLRDLGVLVGLGIGLAASIGVAGVAGSGTSWLLSHAGVHGTLANLVVKVLGIAVSLGVDAALFGWLFGVFAQPEKPRQMVRGGVALASVGFEVLQLVGGTYLRHTTGNPLYGSFAVLIGLLVWINLVVRFTLFAAAWTVTARPVPATGEGFATAPQGLETLPPIDLTPAS